uniref:Uncharacterized protein n=1 Tax=Parascaris equorum TaxID=6256 RepID=A0A914S5Y3_PAREQ
MSHPGTSMNTPRRHTVVLWNCSIPYNRSHMSTYSLSGKGYPHRADLARSAQ